MDPHWLSKAGHYLLPLLVVAVVGLRLFRNPPRKVKPNRLFVMPLLLALATWLTLSQTGAPGGVWLLIDLAAILAGAGVGYLIGRHREFTLDRSTGEIVGRATPIGTLIFAALFAARYGLKAAFPQLNAGQTFAPSSAVTHSGAGLIGWTEAGLVFSTAMLIATAATTWLRTRHLVAQQKTPAVEQNEPTV